MLRSRLGKCNFRHYVTGTDFVSAQIAEKLLRSAVIPVLLDSKTVSSTVHYYWQTALLGSVAWSARYLLYV